jgi:hypothetical protein
LSVRARELSDSRICRTFVRSKSSPPNFDETQSEFNQVCDFGRRLAAILPDEPTADIGSFLELLKKRPPITNRMLKDMYEARDRALAAYVAYLDEYKRIKKQGDYGSGKLRFMAKSPNLIAIAVALRMTKVTGEIRLEGQKS